MTVNDMAHFFGVPAHRLERVLLRHRIDPLFRAGRTRMYGPEQVRRINALLPTPNTDHATPRPPRPSRRAQGRPVR